MLIHNENYPIVPQDRPRRPILKPWPANSKAPRSRALVGAPAMG